MELTLSGARYNLKIGDKITIDIGDEEIIQTIYNIEISSSNIYEISKSSTIYQVTPNTTIKTA